MDMLEIIEYQDQYKSNLKELSYEWLEKYVSVEPEDERILNKPNETVIEGGGHIFFAKFNGKIVGTVSLIKIDEGSYEVAKLAVTELYQGRKIGRQLIEKCIQTAKQAGAKKIILYTNHVLQAAIHLYKYFGFKEIQQNVKKYIEADIMMELKI
ncbi:GNAT family N-acetyltransferase [Desulforamulus ruminis]|uniref:GCN5-related N-acetyltransferase n=1 Tax=Desulforamulus ruminis (strain ATCC 23193 / DSM 2154 / NCIMB 8452 / DL) TaxID=696281 RepID=F6DL38_DESRL|nr:GNAT family N-acetyltransferase [Desulforamulus ruminis]AEG58347.1 GCN5-related N-acetyltransferase [Desulforamulus ruminis DSM 2154]